MQRPTNINTLLAIAAMSLLLLLAACATPAEKAENVEEQVDQELDRLDKALAQDLEPDRAAMTEDLRNLRIRIADKLVEVEKKLASNDLTKEERAEWQTYRSELVAQRDRIDRNLSAVGLATRDTWNDAKRETESIANDVEDWFKRQAEKVDTKTDRDGDHDGH